MKSGCRQGHCCKRGLESAPHLRLNSLNRFYKLSLIVILLVIGSCCPQSLGLLPLISSTLAFQCWGQGGFRSDPGQLERARIKCYHFHESEQIETNSAIEQSAIPPTKLRAFSSDGKDLPALKKLSKPSSSSSHILDPLSSSASDTPSQVELHDAHQNKKQSFFNERNVHYHLTIIIPAYNEIERVGETLLTYISQLKCTPVHPQTFSTIHNCGRGNVTDTSDSTVKNTRKISGQVSIIVVDDGSTDGTAEFVKEKVWLNESSQTLSENREKFELSSDECWQVDENVICISLEQNEGKGAAIERGMKEIKVLDGKVGDGIETRYVVLVADADGSGEITCISDMLIKLEKLIKSRDDNGMAKHSSVFHSATALVVGYRQTETKSPLRSLLSWGFRTAVSSIFLGASLGVSDTQCGFKLMTASTGKMLYNQLNLKRWTHDVEVIHRAQLLEVPVGECEVKWTDKEGSKLVTSVGGAAIVSVQMLLEIARMRLEYALGKWSALDGKEHML